MANSLVEVERREPVAVVFMRRSEQRNALSCALRDELEQTFAQLDGDDAVRAVVLTGDDKAFSAGYDMKEMIATDFESLLYRGVEFSQQVFWFEKPLVTAVAGVAVAGGFDLALAGDVIVAAEGARVGRPEGRWGVNPLMSRLWHRVGMTRAVQLSLRAELHDAARALELGLVDRVVPAGQLLEAAISEAEAMCVCPLPAARAVKRFSKSVASLPVPLALEMELGTSARLIDDDLKKQLRAYAAERGVRAPGDSQR